MPDPAPGDLGTRLTWSNLCALRIIDLYVRSYGFGPSLRELADLMRLQSHNSALHHVLRLYALGLVRLERTARTGQIKAGSLQLTGAGFRALARYERNARFPKARKPQIKIRNSGPARGF